MLAQGQSSSAKRGGLAADVSSGLISLKKQKKQQKQVPLKHKSSETFGFSASLFVFHLLEQANKGRVLPPQRTHKMTEGAVSVGRNSSLFFYLKSKFH